ncbi:UNVERIFIED_ORG: ABC transporter ATP-binding protein [Lacrimispora saccharolytica]
MAYIKFENIHKNFGDNHVLKGINLEIEKGELVTLLGPSGCGKSTLLRCLSGLEDVTEGKIFLDGKDITLESPKKRQIGMVFQQYSLFPNLTAGQNVAFGLKIKKMDKKQIEEKVGTVLELVGLSDKKNQFPNSLSGGQQQRVALARAIVMEPKVLLLDEPLSAIDALLRRNLQTEIRRIQKQLEITTVFVTHDQEEAMVMSDTIHLFNNGNVEQSGSPVEIYTHPATYFAASFIGRYNVIETERFDRKGKLGFSKNWLAIRPETIKIIHEEKELPFEKEIVENSYNGEKTAEGKVQSEIVKTPQTVEMTGVVMERVTHGNIVAYVVKTEELSLKVDCLFGGGRQMEPGDHVRLTIQCSDIIELQ